MPRMSQYFIMSFPRSEESVAATEWYADGPEAAERLLVGLGPCVGQLRVAKEARGAELASRGAVIADGAAPCRTLKDKVRGLW